jgi:Flp pilus assembly protein TadD
MLRGILVAGLLLVGACAPTAQDRVRDYADDGAHLYRNGSYADAREHFRAALKLKPDDPDLLYNLAQCHDRLNEKAEAGRIYKECLQRAPDHEEARYAYLELLVDTGRQEEGVRLVRDWLRSQPNKAGPYVADGWLCARNNDLDSARVRFQRALDFDPRHARALVELARVYERLGRRDRAVVLYERALEANPDQPAIRKLVVSLRNGGISQPHPD